MDQNNDNNKNANLGKTNQTGTQGHTLPLRQQNPNQQIHQRMTGQPQQQYNQQMTQQLPGHQMQAQQMPQQFYQQMPYPMAQPYVPGVHPLPQQQYQMAQPMPPYQVMPGHPIPPSYSQQMIYQPYQPPPPPGLMEQMITAVKYPMGMGNYKKQLYYEGQLYQPQPIYQTLPDGTVVVQEAFDAHTRFDMTKANIPPPPPGVAPNAAQMAIMKGKKVMLGKKSDSWIDDINDGGSTFW